MKPWLLVLCLGTAPVLAQQYEYIKPTTLPPPPPLKTLPADTTPKVAPPPPTAPTVVAPEETVSNWQPTLLRRGLVGTLLPTGAKIPVKVFQTTSFPSKNEFPIVVEIAEDVMGPNGERVLPKGSRVQGAFKPMTREILERERSSYKTNTRSVLLGNRFVAEYVTIGTQTLPLDAVSYALTGQPDPKQAGEDSRLKGSAYGMAGGVALGILTGGLALPLVLVGSAAGAVAGGTPPETIQIEPNQPFTLTLLSPLQGQLGS